ncbi:type II toxin-antitoxin system VapC family toxin [Sediminicurvatus halobius]|uniref:PIN domain nuclease n=1 Tax=Sediminicurvatus halobius TaxID=2182432 RepID=A0A2U2N190_9GAMM|nr:PIN domain-containing protein [Spiribacter halobius]PWG62956.1 PIN domain nuclease [Spiribacter halobius]UEX77470.1 PIN domain-containing protein [Spiribacter halobius]
MASLIYLDTHVVAWLYARGGSAVPEPVALRLEASEGIRISPMVRMELQYLFEIGRVAERPLPVLDALGAALGLSLCNLPFSAVVRQAEEESWTRDPFDRLIVAQARLADAPLITKDASIHEHYALATWAH